MDQFIEGYIKNSLSKYVKNDMNTQQFGFVPGYSIEECRIRVIGRIQEAILQKE